MKITLADARSFPCSTKYGLCSKGLRSFGDKYNLDWKEFISVGLDDSVLLETGDAMAKKLVEWVHDGR